MKEMTKEELNKYDPAKEARNEAIRARKKREKNINKKG